MKKPQHNRAIIYTRVSTSEQAEHGFSLAAQKESLYRYCQQKGMNVVAFFEEDGRSGKTFNRREYNRMLAQIKSGAIKADSLVVANSSRFARNHDEAVVMTIELKRYGIDLIIINEDYDKDSPFGVVMRALSFALPEAENRMRAMATKAGTRRALKEGRWMNNAPVGYCFTPDASGKRLLIPSDKAPLVIEAFEEVAKGVRTMEEVRRALQRKGLQRSKAQFARTMRNPFYAGWIRIEADEDEPAQTIRGLHAPLIDDALFEQVQAVLDGRKRQFGAKTYSKLREDFPLRGQLQCSRCGKTLTGSAIKGGRYLYYHCQRGCGERFRVDAAQERFLELLRTFNARPEFAKLYLAVVQDVHRKKAGDQVGQMARVDADLQTLETKLLKVDERFVEGDIARDSYERLKQSYNERKRELERRKAELASFDANLERSIHYGVRLALSLPENYERAPLEIKRKMVGLIFPEKLIYANGEYQTPRVNEAIALLCGKSTQNTPNTERPTTLSDDRSLTVPRTRLELVLPP